MKMPALEAVKKYALRMTKYEGSVMISICDLELVGTKLEYGELVINLTKEYFQEEVIEEHEAAELLNECSIANLVGERIVSKAINLRLAKELSVRRISGIPFLMIYKFGY
jgi:hypothetical protein